MVSKSTMEYLHGGSKDAAYTGARASHARRQRQRPPGPLHTHRHGQDGHAAAKAMDSTPRPVTDSHVHATATQPTIDPARRFLQVAVIAVCGQGAGGLRPHARAHSYRRGLFCGERAIETRTVDTCTPHAYPLTRARTHRATTIAVGRLRLLSQFSTPHPPRAGQLGLGTRLNHSRFQRVRALQPVLVRACVGMHPT